MPNRHASTAVEITLKGEVDPVTGMVMNLVDLKECIKLAVMDPLDHRNLVSQIGLIERAKDLNCD